MKNLNIAKVLKQHRKQKQLTVKDVAILLNTKDLPVAAKTIYGWESGQTQPDADTLLILCTLYGIDDVLQTFGYSPNEKKPLHLTDFEEKLILQYRNFPDMQDAVHKLLDLQ